MGKTRQTVDAEGFDLTANVVPLRRALSPSQRAYLLDWLKAGLRMGLCSAEIETHIVNGQHEIIRHVVIWVRENPDPAYLIEPKGTKWVLVDHVRRNEIGVFACFEKALQKIRPVLSTPPRGPASPLASL